MSSNQAHTLFHAADSEAILVQSFVDIEAPTFVSDRQNEFVVYRPQADLSLGRPTMLVDVTQCFLNDPEQA